MAYRILEIGDLSGDFGPCGAGNIIVQAEVGVFNDQTRQITNTTMATGEQWSIEQADADLDDDARLWSAVHYTGGTNTPNPFNGITETNRIMTFYAADGYVFRVRRTAGTGNNTNVAFTWDQVRMREWH